MTVRTLVTGGVRSGKSAYAESLLAGRHDVTYLTPGYPSDPETDPEWAARVASHRLRRPPSWATIETLDLAVALQRPGAILVDCLGTWVTRTLDELDAWTRPESVWRAAFAAELDRLRFAWSATTGPLIGVTNEVGWGVVSEHRSGRLFADLLGRTNQAIASASDEVVLMVAGRPLRLPSA